MSISGHLCILESASRIYNQGRPNETIALNKAYLALKYGEAIAVWVGPALVNRRSSTSWACWMPPLRAPIALQDRR